MKKGNLVKFHTIQDNSGDATELHDADPGSSWFEIDVCADVKYGIINESGTIQVIDRDGEITNEFYSINDNESIQGQLEKLEKIKQKYDLSNSDIFSEDEDVETFKDFKKISKIAFIDLKQGFERFDFAKAPKDGSLINVLYKDKDDDYTINSRIVSYINNKWIEETEGCVFDANQCNSICYCVRSKRRFVDGGIVEEKLL